MVEVEAVVEVLATSKQVLVEVEEVAQEAVFLVQEEVLVLVLVVVPEAVMVAVAEADDKCHSICFYHDLPINSHQSKHSKRTHFHLL